jgi:hypothetical protein
MRLGRIAAGLALLGLHLLVEVLGATTNRVIVQPAFGSGSTVASAISLEAVCP